MKELLATDEQKNHSHHVDPDHTLKRFLAARNGDPSKVLCTLIEIVTDSFGKIQAVEMLKKCNEWRAQNVPSAIVMPSPDFLFHTGSDHAGPTSAVLKRTLLKEKP